MLNPFRKIEEIKAEKQRAKEEKLRKRKQQQKKELVISGLFLAVCALIITIGSCNEAKTNNSINDNASIIQTTEPISAPTAEPTVVPSIAPTLTPTPAPTPTPTPVPVFSLSGIPAYGSSAYVAVNNNIPYFSTSEYTTTSFEKYTPLDSLGRCGVAYACIGKDIMPTEERGSIGQVKPSGWQTIRYENVDGKYLYNRCHLIGYQLSGENANTQNLITGTRYMNVEGMLPFENMVADYVKETNNHVLYRVTPVFDGNNLLATGVLMEALSVEDGGASICFNVFCYNVQPGIKIDYATGNSSAADGSAPYGSSDTTNAAVSTTTQQTETANTQVAAATTYIANKNTKKFHYPSCRSVKQMKESNKKELNCTRDEAISQGYSPCGNCDP